MPGMIYNFARKFLFAMDAERAHDLTLSGLKHLEAAGLVGALLGARVEGVPREVMGLRFPNPLGLAAGMDKTGAAVDGMGALGFGHIEVGTATPRAQLGNPAPRLFRLPEHEAVINRMGFNNPGIEAVVANLEGRRYRGILGVNLGKNFDTANEEAARDYRAGLRVAYGVADYFAVNLSSPNTMGLRDLQGVEACEALIQELFEERERLQKEYGVRRPIAVKFAPDLSDEHLAALAESFNGLGVDGVIATNTTLERSGVEGHPAAGERGGLSGAPLRNAAMRHLKLWREALSPSIPVIAVGGIMSGEDAAERLRAGAALVQIYTGLIYRGPGLVGEILRADPARSREAESAS